MTIGQLLYQPLRFIITLIQVKEIYLLEMIEQKEAWLIRYANILSLSSCALSRHCM